MLGDVAMLGDVLEVFAVLVFPVKLVFTTVVLVKIADVPIEEGVK